MGRAGKIDTDQRWYHKKKNPLYAFSRLVVRALSGPIGESAAMLWRFPFTFALLDDEPFSMQTEI